MDREWLKQRPASAGQTQASLARALGLDRSQITLLVGGKRELRIAEVAAVARHLDCHPVDVLRACGLDVMRWKG